MIERHVPYPVTACATTALPLMVVGGRVSFRVVYATGRAETSPIYIPNMILFILRIPTSTLCSHTLSSNHCTHSALRLSFCCWRLINSHPRDNLFRHAIHDLCAKPSSDKINALRTKMRTNRAPPKFTSLPLFRLMNFARSFRTKFQSTRRVICPKDCLPALAPYLRIRVLGHVNPSRHPRSLCATGDVHSVAEEAVSGHPISYHTCHYLSRMDSDCDLLLTVFGPTKDGCRRGWLGNGRVSMVNADLHRKWGKNRKRGR